MLAACGRGWAGAGGGAPLTGHPVVEGGLHQVGQLVVEQVQRRPRRARIHVQLHRLLHLKKMCTSAATPSNFQTAQQGAMRLTFACWQMVAMWLTMSLTVSKAQNTCAAAAHSSAMAEMSSRRVSRSGTYAASAPDSLSVPPLPSRNPAAHACRVTGEHVLFYQSQLRPLTSRSCHARQQGDGSDCGRAVRTVGARLGEQLPQQAAARGGRVALHPRRRQVVLKRQPHVRVHEFPAVQVHIRADVHAVLAATCEREHVCMFLHLARQRGMLSGIYNQV